MYFNTLQKEIKTSLKFKGLLFLSYVAFAVRDLGLVLQSPRYRWGLPEFYLTFDGGGFTFFKGAAGALLSVAQRLGVH